MKFLTIILVAHILYLSCSVCGQIQEVVATSMEVCTDHPHDSHDGPCDDEGCSPFCACQCCHTATLFSINTFTSTGVILDGPADEIFGYAESSTFEIIDAFWHPPRFI